MTSEREAEMKSYSGWNADEVARNPRAAADVIERLRTRLLDEFRLSEEPEWEYAYEVDGYWDEDVFVIEDYRDVGDTSVHALARRRKAGPWEPVN